MQNSKITLKKQLILLLPFFLFFTILTFFVSENIFFWDTVQLGAKHGLFFYETNFSEILLPDNMDSGHIPVFGIYLAFIWKTFGKTLFVSHFAMLPFLLGIIWQAFIFINRFISKKYHIPALILFLTDATLLGQSALVSPDIVLVFFFLLGLNSVFDRRRLLTAIAIVGLFLTSMRGSMVSLTILLTDILINTKFRNIKLLIIDLFKKSIVYIPALLIFIAYNYYHFKIKGWVLYHEDSPWASSFVKADFNSFLFNIGILIWRIIDFGRVFIYITALVLFIKYFRSIIKDKKSKQLLFIFLFVFFNLSVSFTTYKSLSGHRYILPIFLIFNVFTAYLIFEKLKSVKLKNIVFTVILFGSLSGNFWIYPEKISQGWDSSLAHLNYYNLRKNMIKYLEEEDIEIETVGCAFPNITLSKNLDLSNNSHLFPNKNLSKNQYVLFSNVFNDFEDSEIDSLKTEFTLKKEYHSLGVFMKLYKANHK